MARRMLTSRLRSHPRISSATPHPIVDTLLVFANSFLDWRKRPNRRKAG